MSGQAKKVRKLNAWSDGTKAKTTRGIPYPNLGAAIQENKNE